MFLERVGAGFDQVAPGYVGGAESEKAEEGLEQDDVGDQQGRVDDHRTDNVGDDVAQDDTPVRGAQNVRGLHELAVAQTLNLAADDPRQREPLNKADG